MKDETSTEVWYRENVVYNYTNPDFSNTNHFAKVIWAGARQIGIGRAYSQTSNTMYVVATYYPGGYLEESYKDYIKKPCSK